MDLADFNCNYLNELLETRITSHSNTLIDNIFSNVIDPDIILHNLTVTISDYLPQFAIIPKTVISQAINLIFCERD